MADDSTIETQIAEAWLEFIDHHAAGDKEKSLPLWQQLYRLAEGYRHHKMRVAIQPDYRNPDKNPDICRE